MKFSKVLFYVDDKDAIESWQMSPRAIGDVETSNRNIISLLEEIRAKA